MEKGNVRARAAGLFCLDLFLTVKQQKNLINVTGNWNRLSHYNAGEEEFKRWKWRDHPRNI